MRAILVCVDYADYLNVTLGYNRHHFTDVLVVTSSTDAETKSVAERHCADVFITDCFYDDGAAFNKFKAMERGLDVMGRDGWICVMDADVLWPKEVKLTLEVGKLITPLRRMMEDMSRPIPPETEWRQLPIHQNVGEWAGYSQIFHARDPALGPGPWHQVDWRHAGGGDTFFQERWWPEDKLRPDWECLHLGLPGRNWCGRSTPRIDGRRLDERAAASRLATLQEFMRVRRERGGRDYTHERLS